MAHALNLDHEQYENALRLAAGRNLAFSKHLAVMSQIHARYIAMRYTLEPLRSGPPALRTAGGLTYATRENLAEAAERRVLLIQLAETLVGPHARVFEDEVMRRLSRQQAASFIRDHAYAAAQVVATAEVLRVWLLLNDAALLPGNDVEPHSEPVATKAVPPSEGALGDRARRELLAATKDVPGIAAVYLRPDGQAFLLTGPEWTVELSALGGELAARLQSELAPEGPYLDGGFDVGAVAPDGWLRVR